MNLVGTDNVPVPAFAAIVTVGDESTESARKVRSEKEIGTVIAWVLLAGKDLALTVKLSPSLIDD